MLRDIQEALHIRTPQTVLQLKLAAGYSHLPPVKPPAGSLATLCMLYSYFSVAIQSV